MTPAVIVSIVIPSVLGSLVLCFCCNLAHATEAWTLLSYRPFAHLIDTKHTDQLTVNNAVVRKEEQHVIIIIQDGAT